MKKIPLLDKTTAWLSSVSAILVGLGFYLLSNSEGDLAPWLRPLASNSWLVTFTPVFVAILNAVVDCARAFATNSRASKDGMKKILKYFSESMPSTSTNGRSNRLTLFKCSLGIWISLSTFYRLSILVQHPNKYCAAVFSWPWRHYLISYIRPDGSRFSKTPTKFRVAEQASLCEGLAGRIWEEGFYVLSDLPAVNAEDVKRITKRDCRNLSLDEDPQCTISDDAREYLKATFLQEWSTIRGLGTFSRHFAGVLIRDKDGEPWGVLMLDSNDPQSPIDNPVDPSNYKSSEGMKRLHDCSSVISALI